jgi:uncharacterized protein DUF6602
MTPAMTHLVYSDINRRMRKKADRAKKGRRVRDFFAAEAEALMKSFRHIGTLIPASGQSGAAHPGEEGRYVESLIRSFLNKHLPQDVRAFSGFILRPATKTHLNNRERVEDDDEHSTQLDIVIYDLSRFPIYERFEEFVIVPPEGIVAIVSIKKNLYESHVQGEMEALSNAVRMCRHKNAQGHWVRGPSTTLLTFSSRIDSRTIDKIADGIFKKILKDGEGLQFDRLIGQVIVLDSFTLFKARPKPSNESVESAQYVLLKAQDAEAHLGLQFLLTGILSAYYDPTRSGIARPGFTSFQSGRSHDREVGQVKVKGLRCCE